MHKSIGIIKEINHLGRIVTPKDFRARLSLEKSVELILTKDGVLIRNPQYELVEVEKNASEIRQGCHEK